MANKKPTPSLVEEFKTHRIWEFLKHSKSTGNTEMLYHYPVSQLATQRYQRLTALLKELGYTTTDVPNNATIPMRIGVLHIGGVQKGRLV